MASTLAPNRWRAAGWSLAAALLLLPLIAMRFTAEVAWTPIDFAVAGVLIGSVGLAMELAVRASRDRFIRAGAAVAVLTAVALVWLNLSVGIIGDEANPANLVFLVVLAVALLGALLARGRPRGMALTMSATAFAQLAVAVLTPGIAAPFTAGFAALWMLAAWLFRRARG